MANDGVNRLRRRLRGTSWYGRLRTLRGTFNEAETKRWEELVRFRAHEGPILRSVRGDASGPTVLYAAPSTPGLYRIRVEAMVAKALEVRGARAVWVVERNDMWHEEHLRAFGFDEFVFYDDYVTPQFEMDALADELLSGCERLEDVLEVTHDGYDVGFHAASRVLNILRRGRLDLRDPEVESQFRATLAWSLRSAQAVDRIYGDVKPDKYIATAQNLTPWAEFYEGALKHGVDTLYWMPSQVEESLLWRRYEHADRHEHFFTLAPDTWDWVRRIPWSDSDADRFIGSLRESYLTGNWFRRKKTLRDKRVKTREDVVSEYQLDPEKKIAFIFSHVLYDATFWFGENLFDDYVEWLVETVRAAAANQELNWILKLHPENVRRLEETVGAYTLEDLEEYRLVKELFPEGLPSHVKLMTPEDDTSTLSLFSVADYAVTVRGTIGLEFPCFGIPTLTAGTGGYDRRGFTIDSDTREEYLGRLARLHEQAALSSDVVALAQRFSYGVFHLKPVPFPSFETHLLPDDQWDRGFNGHSFELRARTPEDVRNAPDLTRFAGWALDSTARDLLAPEADARFSGALADVAIAR